MRNIMQSYGSLAAIGVLAHELGHIIDFNQNRSQIPQAQREATADRYAGCAFALAGNPESDLMGLAQSLHAMGSHLATLHLLNEWGLLERVIISVGSKYLTN